MRIEFPGAVYHITSRGNERRDIFRDDDDRRKFLELLGEVVRRFGWIVTSYTMLDNHFHLVIETPAPTLSRGMQWLNGTYAAWFNRRHKRWGHLLGDRFHALLVEKESYYLELLRYVVLNPVRAKMVERPEQYAWSSYRATAGYETAPEWLRVEEIAALFGDTLNWRENYKRYVDEKLTSEERLFDKVERQLYLGTEEWVASMRKLVESKLRSDDHPRAQRTVGRPKMATIVDAVAGAFRTSAREIRESRGGAARMLAAWLGWYEGLHRLRSIAAALRLRSSGRISDLVAEAERALRGDPELQRLVDAACAALG
jgi:REP element-mobilizing transposase RayT